MTQRRGIRALQLWCSRAVSSYSNVNITDLSKSFSDGLAFCALIHHFRPDLIDYHSLKPENAAANCELAFRLAETYLDIPALLDPEDMVAPDTFSVVTYLSQYYHHFKESVPGDASPITSVSSSSYRGSESENDSVVSVSSAESTPAGTPTTAKKTQPKARVFNRAELVAKYGEEIFSSSSSKVDSVCKDMERKARVSD